MCNVVLIIGDHILPLWKIPLLPLTFPFARPNIAAHWRRFVGGADGLALPNFGATGSRRHGRGVRSRRPETGPACSAEIVARAPGLRAAGPGALSAGSPRRLRPEPSQQLHHPRH